MNLPNGQRQPTHPLKKICESKDPQKRPRAATGGGHLGAEAPTVTLIFIKHY